MLDTLPTELIEHIAACLDRPQLSSLRFVCRSIRDVTVAVFGRAWLGLFETDLSQESLRRLETIAGHEMFRHSVHTLRIARKWQPDHVLVGQPRVPVSPVDFSSPAVVSNFQDTVRRLSHCNAVELCDRVYERNWHRDNNGVAVGLAPTNVLYLVLSLMATNSRPIRKLSIYFQRSYGYRHAKQLPSIAVHSSKFPSLQELDITWRLIEVESEPVFRELALYLVTSCPNLKSFTLGVCLYGHGPLFWEQLVATPALPPIAELRIHSSLDTPHPLLVKVLLRLRKSLQSLRISHLKLCGGPGWHSLFREMLHHGFPCLERIALCNLSTWEGPGLHPERGRLIFCPLRANQEALEMCGGSWEFAALWQHRGKMRVDAVRFTGSPTGMGFALQALADESYYLRHFGARKRAISPGLPDMRDFTSDRIGRVVPRFDRRKNWEGEETFY